MIKIVVVLLLVLAGCSQSELFVSNEVDLAEFARNDLAQARQMSAVDLKDGFELKAEVVQKELFGEKQVMFAYNKQIPGPVLKVKQGDKVKVNFVNNLPFETTVHWHGLRHDNKDDGVPGVTQDAVRPGASFEYELYFPDHGVYWYHPHIREDLQQDAGLAGLIIVEPKQHDEIREEILVLDDLAVHSGSIQPFGRNTATHTLMGRFGSTILANGKTNYELTATVGETIRVYIANVANARPFNISFEGAKMKVIGSDLGYYSKEFFADSIIVAPAERYIVEIQYDVAGSYRILNVNNANTRLVGTVKVLQGSANVLELLEHPEVAKEVSEIEQYFEKPADYELELVSSIGHELMQQMSSSMTGMPCHTMPDGSLMGDCGGEEHVEKIEWEDNMQAMNSASNSELVKWIIRDTKTGLENMDIPMKAKVGDKIKIVLHNNKDSMHPMQHPIHLHGQRFLILSVDGKKTENYVWKDTVLVPTGERIEILVDVTNPGKWMLHCHIAEHLEAGMMAMMEVHE